MKNLLAGISLALGISLSASQPALAQANIVNCAALSGSPMMCVKNMSGAPVVAIQATPNQNFNPTSWINIPGGPIMPGGTSIVRFNAWNGGCNQFVTIRTAEGRTHTYPFVNVCSSTSFNVTGW